MFRIGIDFDNTIACYDRVFCDVASAMGFVTHGDMSSKENVKERILSRPDGDLDWQRLQGQVYGRYMLQAKIFSGFFEFLYLSKLRGHEVFIVSHKSEFGHFDDDRISLRDQALRWLQENNFFDGNDISLSRQEVFFESTRAEKIRRIHDLGCTHFIDDLCEVFEDPLFPSEVKKILFRPNSSDLQPDLSKEISASWRDLAARVYGSWTEPEVCRIAQARFASLDINLAELRKGRGNSRVYELAGTEGNYALKVYPDRQRDPRPRLETEFSACRWLRDRGYPVAEAVAIENNLGWGVYRWVVGSVIETSDELFLDEAIEFVRRLYSDSKSVGDTCHFHPASEACFSGLEITRQIQVRLQKLMAVESKELADFLTNEFLPCYVLAADRAKRDCGEIFDAALPRSSQILSTSDFGSHNALRDENGRTVFIDFEYFGWDDPVKLVADFYWHPGMNLSSALDEQWIASALETFRKDSSFSRRLNSYLPLYGIKWCLILLNEFLQHGAAHRLHADPRKEGELVKIRLEQLNKSKVLLGKIKGMTHVHGSAIQAS